MKHVRFIIIFIALFIAFGTPSDAWVIEDGFSTESVSKEDAEQFLREVGLSLITEEPAKNPIICFSVAENRDVAIGCNVPFHNNNISIYTTEGSFKYGYAFQSSGNFGVEFSGDLIKIYFIREEMVVLVNQLGEIVSVEKMRETSGNNRYLHQTVFAKERKIGNTYYQLKNDIGLLELFPFSHAQLVLTDEIGERSIFYDASHIMLKRTITALTVIVVLLCAWIVWLARYLLGLKK